jgi:hypothetical protein
MNSLLKIKSILFHFFILCSIQIYGQCLKSTSFVQKGSIKKITERESKSFFENESMKVISKLEYFFNEDGLLFMKIDSLFNSTTYYYYSKKRFCEKQITKSENKIKYISKFEKTDTSIIGKIFDPKSILLYTSEIKV